MTGIEYLLLGAAVSVLVAGISMVVRGRRAELSDERSAAESLQRMARTLAEIRSELTRPRDDSGGPAGADKRSPQLSIENVASAMESELERAVRDHEVLQIRLKIDAAALRARTFRHIDSRWQSPVPHPPVDIRHEAGSVVDFWEHLTRDATHGQSYSDVLGPVFGDALIHAANVGVVDREQAEVLKEWADSTEAIPRPARAGKRQVLGDARDSVFVLPFEKEMVG